MFLSLIILLVIIFTLLGTIIWNTKNTTSSAPIIACIGEDVKVAYPSTGDPGPFYFFGESVAISGDTLVVGVPGSTTTGTDDYNSSGAVYVYTNGNYTSPPIKAEYPTGTEPQPGYLFGYSIAISGDTLVVGAYGSTTTGTGTVDFSGAVYIYTNGNYTSNPDKVAYPTIGDPQPSYRFGWSIAISGDTLVVGVPGSTTTGTDTYNNSGAVYVYKNGNYTSSPIKAAYPTGKEPQPGYRFGESVAISGDTLVVGARGSTTSGTDDYNNSGAVYIYRNGNYTSNPDKVAYPTIGDPQPGYLFGYSIAISGDTLVVGAYGSTTTGTDVYNNSGAVYVYKNGNYTSAPIKVPYLTGKEPQPNYRFGIAVAISGDTLVVGARGSAQDGTSEYNRSGRVYVYKGGNYTLPPIEVGYVGDYIPLTGYQFGESVCTNGEAVGIGANGQPADGTGTANNAGAVYMYPCIGES